MNINRNSNPKITWIQHARMMELTPEQRAKELDLLASVQKDFSFSELRTREAVEIENAAIDGQLTTVILLSAFNCFFDS